MDGPSDLRRKLGRFVETLTHAERDELARFLPDLALPVDAPADSAIVRRPRLLDILARRFDHRIVVVRAGAGFGKSTLLGEMLRAGAIADGRHDALVGIRHVDDERRVVARACEALGVAAPESPDVARLVEAIWRHAPGHVCLVIDDFQRLPDEAGARLLGPLLDTMPDNGHLVVASRKALPVAVERLRAAGALLELDEADLAFDDEEVEEFLRSRRRADVIATPGPLGSARWPALLELECHFGAGPARRYVDEEILGLIDPGRRRALSMLGAVRRIDDGFVAALTDFEGTAHDLVADLPLVQRHPDGSVVLHDIWLDLLAADLDAAERAERGRRAAQELRRRGELEDAFLLSARTGDDAGLLAAARALVEDFLNVHRATSVSDLLAAVPERLSGELEIDALAATTLFALQPVAAQARLDAVAERARHADDADIEALCRLRLAELAFRSADPGAVADQAAQLRARPVTSPNIMAVGHLLDAWRLLLDHDYAGARARLAEPAVRENPLFTGFAEWYSICAWGWIGHSQRALDMIVGARLPGGRMASRIRGFVAIQKWWLGELDETSRAAIDAVVDDLERAGERHLFVEGAAITAMFHASAGEVEVAAGLVARAAAAAPALEARHWGVIALEQARAVLALLDGDEAQAARILRSAVPADGPLRGLAGHLFADVLALTYLLVPETIPEWERMDAGPELALARNVGRALVAARAGDLAPAVRLPWNEPARLRTWAVEPLLAELAVAAIAAGEEAARPVLDDLRSNPRRDVSRLVGHPARAVADRARELADSSPMRREGTLMLDVLGPFRARRGDRSLGSLLSARRARDLLALLVHHRRISRRDVMATLWPDKPDSAAANNLRVALNRLHSALEPERLPGETPWFVRSRGDDLVLHTGETLSLDVDRFRALVARGRRADDAGQMHTALSSYLDADRLYRGDYLSDLTNLEIGYYDTLRLRADAAQVATRAATLLAAQGRWRDAEPLVSAAVNRDPLHEDAHALLAEIYRATGQLHAARQTVSRFLDALHAAGLEPSAVTRVLAADLSVPTRSGR